MKTLMKIAAVIFVATVELHAAGSVTSTNIVKIGETDAVLLSTTSTPVSFADVSAAMRYATMNQAAKAYGWTVTEDAVRNYYENSITQLKTQFPQKTFFAFKDLPQKTIASIYKILDTPKIDKGIHGAIAGESRDNFIIVNQGVIGGKTDTAALGKAEEAWEKKTGYDSLYFDDIETNFWLLDFLKTQHVEILDHTYEPEIKQVIESGFIDKETLEEMKVGSGTHHGHHNHDKNWDHDWK
jgi:hypothetical protein